MEDNILLSCCEEHSVANTARYLALMDRNELEREDLEWEEVEPYIRVLGVRTRDLYENIEDPGQDMHKIEGKLLEKYEKW